MSLLIIIGGIWGICWLLGHAQRAAKERERARLIAQREQLKRMVALEKEQQRQAKEQARLAREQERQAAQFAKHEARIAKLEQSAAQAREDIDNYAYRIEQLNKKGEYLELERDACIDGGKEWNKWNDKCMANDDKIYRLQRQMNKAQTILENAERELSA